VGAVGGSRSGGRAEGDAGDAAGGTESPAGGAEGTWHRLKRAAIRRKAAGAARMCGPNRHRIELPPCGINRTPVSPYICNIR
jgi:hypothetical protein